MWKELQDFWVNKLTVIDKLACFAILIFDILFCLLALCFYLQGGTSICGLLLGMIVTNLSATLILLPVFWGIENKNDSI